MSARPVSLSIAAVSYQDSPAQLRTLLRSVVASAVQLCQRHEGAAVTLTIIDNSAESGGPPEWAAEAESCGLQLKLLREQGNVGYGRGHNLALAGLDSDIHLMLNTDVVLAEDALTEIVDYFRANPGAVLLSPHATDSAGRKQHLCKRYPAVLTLAMRGFLPPRWCSPFRSRLSRYEMGDLPEDEPSSGIPIVSGCCMACRTMSLLDSGGFDPGYFLYFEDFDLSLRLGKMGDVAYVPAVRISHDGGNTATKGLWHIAQFLRSAWRFFSTHGWRFVRQG